MYIHVSAAQSTAIVQGKCYNIMYRINFAWQSVQTQVHAHEVGQSKKIPNTKYNNPIYIAPAEVNSKYII